MWCRKAHRWISRRLDGALDERFEVLLADHLAECAACRAYADLLTTLDLNVLEVPDPSPDFTARVAQRLEQAPAPRWPVLLRPATFRPFAAGLGIAAALGGFVVGSFLGPADGNDTPRNGTIELAAGEVIDPMADESVESVLIAMLSDTEK